MRPNHQRSFATSMVCIRCALRQSAATRARRAAAATKLEGREMTQRAARETSGLAKYGRKLARTTCSGPSGGHARLRERVPCTT
jgi:hypothetical protein